MRPVSSTREAAPRSRNFKIREIEFFLGACASAAIYKNYAEVGAYNSSWIKSYEHRSKLFFLVPHLHVSHAFFRFLVFLLCSLYFNKTSITIMSSWLNGYRIRV